MNSEYRTERVKMNQVSGFLHGQKPQEQQQKRHQRQPPRESFAPGRQHAKRRERQWRQADTASTADIRGVIRQIERQREKVQNFAAALDSDEESLFLFDSHTAPTHRNAFVILARL
jgi:light-regulated signal transduction histidine kinase (bacteriophytochrome)